MEPGEAETLARELGVKFFRACVKENFNVDNVFDYLVDQWSKGSNKAQPAMDIRELAAGVRRGRRTRPRGGRRGSAAAGGEDGTSTVAGKRGEEAGGRAFMLEKPNTERTGGKKSKMQRLKTGAKRRSKFTKCSVI